MLRELQADVAFRTRCGHKLTLGIEEFHLRCLRQMLHPKVIAFHAEFHLVCGGSLRDGREGGNLEIFPDGSFSIGRFAALGDEEGDVRGLYASKSGGIGHGGHCGIHADAFQRGATCEGGGMECCEVFRKYYFTDG